MKIRSIRLLLLLLCTALGAALGTAAASGFALATVQPGDSIGAIADRYNISVGALMSYNDLRSSVIHPGQVLRVPYVEATGGVAEAAPTPPPGFRQHVLAQGETLSDVTSRYGISLKALVGANPDLSSLDRLPVGVELLIPPREGLVVTLPEGATLTELMEVYGIGPVELVRANGITSPDDIRPGMMVFLPGVEPTSALERLARVREMENRYVWPVQGRITSYFGRRNLGMGTSNFHKGVDVAAPWGTPVVAARSGTVTYAGWSNQGYGYLVKIRHQGGAETYYAHFSKILVSVGEYVRQNEIIGRIGSTGISTGPHLHFELRERGRALDPLTELR